MNYLYAENATSMATCMVMGFPSRVDRHDPEGCDVIVCWRRHNWAECPERIEAVELSRLVSQTSRLSAVVIHKRVPESSTIKNEWKVYPTNRADPDAVRLCLAELRRFGELDDREHLAAEYALNSEGFR